MKEKFRQLVLKAQEVFRGETNEDIIAFMQSLFISVLYITESTAYFRKDIYDEIELHCKKLAGLSRDEIESLKNKVH